jgi:hypothetical protein
MLDTPAKYGYNAYRLDTDSRFPGFGFPSVTNLDVSFGSGTNVKTSNKNPNYRDQIAKRLDATTDHRRTVNSAKPVYVRHVSKTYAPGYFTESNFSSFTLGFNDILVEPSDLLLRDQALIKFKRKLGQRTSDFKAIAPLVELKQLRQLVRSAARSAEEYIRGLVRTRNALKLNVPIKRGRLYTYQGLSPSLLSQLSDSWLQFSFGLSPTIADANNLVKAIDDHLTGHDEVYRDRASATRTWSTSNSLTASGSASANLIIDSNFEHRLTYAFGSGVQLAVEAASSYNLLDKFGLTFGDIIPAFWELTPYSWVVDYFTTMGAFLDDEFSIPAGSTVFLYETKKYTRSVVSQVSFSKVSAQTIVDSSNSGTASQEYFGYTRSKLSSIPHVSLRFKTLDEIGVNSVKRLLNLTSLLVKR